MTIAYVINGSRVVIPGVYSRLLVEGSLPVPAPSGRSVLILGEADEGAPGTDLDLKLNYFQKFSEVQEYYKSGRIVDAARQLFSVQPADVFAGTLSRLYVYKTNDSVRATREIEDPSNYGHLDSATYGEAGNTIKTQINTYQEESLPLQKAWYLPSSVARTFKVVVSGKMTDSLSVAADGVASDFVTAMSGVSGLSVIGGADKVDATDAMDVDLTVVGDILTISKSAGAGVFDDSSIAIGDVCYIQDGTALAGASDENAGVYEVTAVSSSSISLKLLKKLSAAGEVNAVAYDTDPVAAVPVGSLLINAPIYISVDETTLDGSGATLEIMEESADQLGNGMLLNLDSFSDLLADSTSSIANISAAVGSSANQLVVSLNTGSWISTPKVGDLVRIDRDSLLAGSALKNVGVFVVKAASSKSLTLEHLFSGMTTEAVSSVALAGANDTLEVGLSFVSSDVVAKRLDSSAERKVSLDAIRMSDSSQLPEVGIGGNPVLEISYYNAAATACTLTIDPLRVMTITPTGSGLSAFSVNLKKYDKLSDLISFLNSKAGISAKATSALNASLAVSKLDAVQDLHILSGSALPAYNGRIKKDYSDFVQYFEDNFSILSFRAGTMTNKVGLPAAEASSVYLEGGLIGSSNTAAFQAGLDAGLLVDVSQVVPLVSRDADKDIIDGLTESDSSYSIASVHAAVKAHVSTAASIDYQSERMGMLSYYGSFEDSKDLCGDVSVANCQMTFQLHNAQNGEGELIRFQPWMSACALAAGRAQAIRGTSMLRKPFLLSSAEHIGDKSMFDDTLVQEFDPNNRGQLEEAIEAGLVVFREVQGFGVRMESADNTTRSRDNDPQAWVYERSAVQFTLWELSRTVRSVLDNYIGRRTTDVSATVLRQACNDALQSFLPGTGDGSCVNAVVTDVELQGTMYKIKLRAQPAEALEAISVDVYATRQV